MGDIYCYTCGRHKNESFFPAYNSDNHRRQCNACTEKTIKKIGRRKRKPVTIEKLFNYLKSEKKF